MSIAKYWLWYCIVIFWCIDNLYIATSTEMLPAASWNWASMECQQLMVLQLGQSKWLLIARIHKQVISRLYEQISMWYSRDSLLHSNKLYHLHRCNQVLTSVLDYKNGQNWVYGLSQPQCGLINNDLRPKIVDSWLTHIFKMGQGACRFLFCL